jgi:hypothetical protein
MSDGTALVELVDSLLRICTNIFTTAALHAVSHERRISTSSLCFLASFYAEPSRAAASFCAFSCSMICFDQYLEGANLPGCCEMCQQDSCCHVPSRFNPPNTYLGHLVSVLPLCADTPGHSCDSKHDTHNNSSVCLPVLRLSVPTTGGRPDVLGVPVVALSSAIESHHARARDCYTYGTLAPPPMSVCVGFIVGVFEVLRGYLPITRLYR